MPTYKLTVNEKQLCIIRQACEWMARMYMGQVDCLLFDMGIGYDSHDAHVAAQQLKEAMTGLDGHAYHSLTSDKVDDDARIAWDIYQVVRHQLAWDNLKPEHERGVLDIMGVCFDVPRATSYDEHELATIEKVEDDA